MPTHPFVADGYRKLYIVRAQTAANDCAYGALRTLGDPYTDVAKAIARRDAFLRNYPTYGHAFIETHWIEG